MLIPVAVPRDFSSQLSNLLLLAKLDQKFQTLLNGLFFGVAARGFESFGHQLVVYDDVRSHAAPMYIDLGSKTAREPSPKNQGREHRNGHLTVSEPSHPSPDTPPPASAGFRWLPGDRRHRMCAAGFAASPR